MKIKNIYEWLANSKRNRVIVVFLSAFTILLAIFTFFIDNENTIKNEQIHNGTGNNVIINNNGVSEKEHYRVVEENAVMKHSIKTFFRDNGVSEFGLDNIDDVFFSITNRILDLQRAESASEADVKTASILVEKYKNQDYGGAINKVLAASDNEFSSISDKMTLLGILENKRYDYSKSVKYFKMAYETFLNKKGEDWTELLSLYSNSLYQNGELESSKSVIGELLNGLEEKSVFEKGFGYVYLTLGKIQLDESNFKEAEKNFKRFIKYSKGKKGDFEILYADALNNMGELCKYTYRYDKALDYYFEAIRVSDQNTNVPDFYRWPIVDNIGQVYFAKGDYSKAEKYLLEALSGKKKVFGSNSPFTAITLEGLGQIYLHMNDFEKSEKFFVEAIKIFEGQKNNHPRIATAYIMYSDLLIEKKKYAYARELLLKAWNITVDGYGVKNPSVSEIYQRLGRLDTELRNYDTAEEEFFKAKEINDEIFGNENTETAMIYSGLGLCYHYQGKKFEAKIYYEKAIEIFKKNKKDNIDQANIVKMNYEDLLRQMGLKQ